MSREVRDVKYAAARLGCSVNNIYELVSAGALACVDVGAHRGRTTTQRRTARRLRFLDDDLDAFITRRRQAAAEKDTPRAVAERQARSYERPTLVGAGRYR